MLKDIKEIRIFGGVLVFSIVMLSMFAVISQNPRDAENKRNVGIYFINPATNTLEREEHVISLGNNSEMINELMTTLLKGPNSKALAKTIPDYLKLASGSRLIENKYILELEFESDGTKMSGEEELFFKSSLVYTMTEIDAVSDLHIYVDGRELMRSDGEPYGLLNRGNVVINSNITPFVSDVLRLVLYFTDETMAGLVPEERVIQVEKSNPDQNIEKYVVEQLILGPSRPEHYGTVPTDTKIREVSTDGDICYVNLSSEFFNKLAGSVEVERLGIYSLVNSLTELSDIKKVQFLIDSKKPEGLKVSFDLSKPLERDEEIIMR